ncbi:MAG: phosphotransferase [Gammaproteobacteria bacterium]|nr:phosphotransferase [Gammaproteobacteria bacterium]
MVGKPVSGDSFRQAAADEYSARGTAGGADLASLHRELLRLERFGDIRPDALVPMLGKGLTHAHAEIRGTGAVLRIPRLSVHGFGPMQNLAYQAACFDRAAPSGATPLLLGRIAPGEGIPWGALIVQKVAGTPPVLPNHLPRIARSLAALHLLALPDKKRLPPLPHHRDPVRVTVEVIAAQSTYLERAGIGQEALRQLHEEIAWARSFAAPPGFPAHPVTLAGSDTHPGNFMVRKDGRAVFVDLEKLVYGSPVIDLAHASVYTSTMWDADIRTALTRAQVSRFHDAYFDAVPQALGDRIRPWCKPMRRLTWLRTTTWCAKWQVEARAGTVWSPALRNPAFMEALRARFSDYFDPETITRIREGFRREPCR